MVDILTVALWATTLARPLNGIEAWAQSVEARMAEAAGAGARLLVMPEYACEQWLSFAPSGLPRDREIPWMAAHAEAALEALRPLPAKYGIALLAGSMAVGHPTADGHVEFRNRAWLLLPDGRAIGHDKLVLTPPERDPMGWHLATGDRLAVVEWSGIRLATLICLDVEMPALAMRLAGIDLDLLLVPSMTALRSGYRRVFDCAKARAVELQTSVCAVGAIGAPAPIAHRDTNCSGAAAFTPCEAALGHDGIVASIGPWSEIDGAGPVLIAQLPIGAVRASRRGGAEVWPGAWRADHIVIDDPAGEWR